MKKGVICALAALAMLTTGCFKKVSDTTVVVLQPRLQAASGDEEVPLEGVRTYAYGVDTAAWTVRSYEDALSGVITSTLRPEERLTTPAAEGAACDPAFEGWQQMTLSGPVQMIVAVDTEHRLFAYTQQRLEENLPRLYVALTFKPWKQGFAYKEGRWSFRNDFYAPPRVVTCLVEGAVEASEGAEPVALTSVQQMKLYAFAADTTAWCVASYDDALQGRITSRRDMTVVRDKPNATAYYDKQAKRFSMELDNETIMAVAVDMANRIYAYTELHVDLDGEGVEQRVLFRPWRQETRYGEEGWRYVAPERTPAGSETPATRRSGAYGLRPAPSSNRP